MWKTIFSLRDSRASARLLSVLGRLPFIIGVAVAWVGPEGLKALAQDEAAIYAAVILSFLGAIHWGRVLSEPLADPLESLWLVWGVVPSLIGWLGLLLPRGLGLPLMVLGFVLAWAIDRRAVSAGLLPDWYGRLRTPLSLTVCLCLALLEPLAL